MDRADRTGVGRLPLRLRSAAAVDRMATSDLPLHPSPVEDGDRPLLDNCSFEFREDREDLGAIPLVEASLRYRTSSLAFLLTWSDRGRADGTRLDDRVADSDLVRN